MDNLVFNLETDIIGNKEKEIKMEINGVGRGQEFKQQDTK